MELVRGEPRILSQKGHFITACEICNFALSLVGCWVPCSNTIYPKSMQTPSSCNLLSTLLVCKFNQASAKDFFFFLKIHVLIICSCHMDDI